MEADTDFRVSPDGSDRNDGVSAPKRSIGPMIRDIQSNWDARGFTARVVCEPGVYEPFGMKGEVTGAIEPLRIVGSTTRGACVIRGGRHAVYIDQARLLVEGFTITAPGGAGIAATNGSRVEYRDIEWGECGPAHVAAEKGGTTYALAFRADGRTKAHHLFSAPAERHLYVNGGGIAFVTEMINSHMEFLDRLKFTIFCDVIQSGCMTAHTNNWTGPEPDCPAIYVRWASSASQAFQLPGDPSRNFCDETSKLDLGRPPALVTPPVTR